jgi:hypothetical protein
LTPQLPQLVVVPRFVSHPLARLPSQLPLPLLQLMAQLPLTQAGVPSMLLHETLQPLQWLGSEAMSCSQPLDGSPSQSAHPGLHFKMPHLPLVQLGVAC